MDRSDVEAWGGMFSVRMGGIGTSGMGGIVYLRIYLIWKFEIPTYLYTNNTNQMNHTCSVLFETTRCVKSAGLYGFTQLAFFGIWATKRVFTQQSLQGELTNNHSSCQRE